MHLVHSIPGQSHAQASWLLAERTSRRAPKKRHWFCFFGWCGAKTYPRDRVVTFVNAPANVRMAKLIQLSAFHSPSLPLHHHRVFMSLVMRWSPYPYGYFLSLPTQG